MKPEEAIVILMDIQDNLEETSFLKRCAIDMGIEALQEQRPHGEWIRRHYITDTKSFDMYVCSNCGEEFSYDAETGISMANYKFCPNCGADMRKERGSKAE